MASKVKIGIIGAGRIGQVHAQSLVYRLPQADVMAVSDPFGDAAEQCAARFQIPIATRSHRAILAHPEIEAVVICSSTDTHTQLICEAAEAGKHIFCEKPIALDLAEIDRALAVVARCGVQLQIGFNRRFDSNFRHLQADGGRRWHRHPRSRPHHQPRSSAAADQLYQSFWRHLPGYDDPRF